LRVYAVYILIDLTSIADGLRHLSGKWPVAAAHVFGSASYTKPVVCIAGMDLPAKAINEGAYQGT
jgi:hypothetical protein